MKSERRHEIQENSLAHFLEGAFESARPHATLIGGILLALVLAYIAFVVMMQNSGPIQDKEWQSVYTTLDQSFRVGEDDVAQKQVADEFATISKDYGKSRPALWSEYFYGQQILTQASDLAFSDPKSATADLDRAVQAFQKVYDETDLPILKVKALWAMAEAYELQASKESLGKAKANFEEITKIWPDTNTAKLAQERIERLNNPALTGDDGFYAWYREQDFAAHTAEAAAKNRAPIGGSIPGMDMNLEPGGGLFDAPGSASPGSALPGTSLPGGSLPGMTLPGLGTPGGTTPGTETGNLFTPSMNLDSAGDENAPKPSSFTEKEEAATSEKPAGEPMKTETPAEPMTETPAQPEKPAEEAPKGETPAKEEPAKEEPAKEEPKAETPAKPATEPPMTEEKPAEEEKAAADPK
ncbi:hypothetical protein [Blastopirellula marina]|uniref:Tetratricopeptide repeat-like domain-containing protein n=1 Tax=Blastopirellula marina TaxID=124 RepID=A0A2S8G0I0_9BACT|nr:hypothetical protein [Blastopirellula marina]PQO37952.1 hypothetical protein C5Y98_07610 [Blastopirellula marina]PTL44608.1 hypothetical protein C5Y97_07610 [Blastopirellula marina]